MQTAGPYRLRRALSSCAVGDVWSGIDDRGRAVTVAVLNGRAAADERWRSAFAAAAEALGQAGADQLPIVGADHEAARPWVACAVERGAGAAEIFSVLGQQPRPAAAAVPVQPVVDDEVTTDVLAETSARPHSGAGPVAGTARPAEPRPFAGAEQAPHGGLSGRGPWDLPPATATELDRHAEGVVVPPAQFAPGTRPFTLAVDGPALPGYPQGPDGPDAPGPPSAPVSGASVPGAPISGASVSGAPISGASVSGAPISGDLAYPYRSRVFADRPPAKPRRTGLLLGVVALVCLLVGAAGGAAMMAVRNRGGPSGPASATAPARPTPQQLLLPATPPTAPGLEPSVGGGWPSGWPVFTSAESTRPMNALAGVGFGFRVPHSWSCTLQEQAAAAVRYSCGTATGATPASGGELTVRQCAPPCTDQERTALRTQVEAWGLRWTRSGPFTVWAQTNQIGGRAVFGLVYVAFWRSEPEGEIDRQLVLRMTSPPAGSDDLKKVANSIRDRTFTL